MSPTPHQQVDVDRDVQLRLVVPDDTSVPLPVSFRYSTADPYAVRAVFHGGDTEIEWVFARELLAAGLSGPCGEGDVHVWPSHSDGTELVVVTLSSPDGRAVLEADARDVRSFLDHTYAVVAPGREAAHVDVDAALAELLS